jgi:signal transduction histidine kinase
MSQISVTTNQPARRTTYRYRSGRVSIGMFYLLIGVVFLINSLGWVGLNTNEVWPLVLIAVGVGMLLRRARRLQVEEDRSGQLAVAEERVRIARDLHDVVAHGVSLMTIQIAAARRVAERKPEAAADSLAAAEQTGRQTLSELDSMLGVLRGADASIGAAAWGGSGASGPPGNGTVPPGASANPRSPLPHLSDVSELVEQLQRAGRKVEFKVLGDRPKLPASVEVTLYRLIQEAVTNAARYGGEAATITIELIFDPDTISVFVDDDGPGQVVASRPGGGHGLLGMQERVSAVGGSMSAGPRPGGPGWRVHASVPLVAIPLTDRS